MSTNAPVEQSAADRAWVSHRVAEQILCSHYDAIRRLVDAGLIRCQHLPGSQPRLSLGDVLRLAEGSVGPGRTPA